MAARITLRLPFGIGDVEWSPTEVQRRAAWALYVELVTRVAVTLPTGDIGLVREALSSLHSLFSTTRQVLRDAGPAVGVMPESVGGVAIAVLNKGLRPFLTKWHPLYSDWERDKKAGSGRWPHDAAFWTELKALQRELAEYSAELARAARVRMYPRDCFPWFRRVWRRRD